MTAQTQEVVAEAAPILSVVSGTVTDEELAALTVVVGALRQPRGPLQAPENPRISGGWVSHWHLVRTPLYPGRDAWRATLRR